MRNELRAPVLGFLTALLALTSLAAQETLLTIEPTPAYPRNSEGDIVTLADGRVCLIYSRFTGGASDHAAADLVMRTSEDGTSWSEDRIVVPREGGRNVMSVSLLRLADGRIGLFYLRKQSIEDCRPVLRFSSDEAVSFGEPTLCITDQVGYYVMNNDRAMQLESGRLVLPVALHNRPGQEKPDWAGRVMCYLSDDVGGTWRRSKSVLTGRAPGGERVMVQEPGVVELERDHLMMFCRTDAGSQYMAHSRDGGDTWSELAPSSLASPRSPATIERIPWSSDLLCVWNDHSGVHPYPGGGKRSPHCVAVSRDAGSTWSRSRVLEPDPDGWYCYTAMAFSGDRTLLAYCAGDSRVGGLNRLKVVSLSREWLDAVAAAGPARPAEQPFVQPCLDYGRSFVNTRARWNSPRFQVESRCRVVDKAAGRTVEFLQCALCKAERTFAHRDLFVADNYDFLPVFSESEGIIFRRPVRATDTYRDVRPLEKWWGGADRKLRVLRGRVLRTPEEVFAAMQAGRLIVGQTELRDEESGRVAVIEYPVKTINFERDRKDWQVDTGPVILPDLSAPPEEWSRRFELAHIAFRTPYWADFIVDRPTPVRPEDAGDENGARTFHYSHRVHRTARSVLLVLEGE